MTVLAECESNFDNLERNLGRKYFVHGLKMCEERCIRCSILVALAEESYVLLRRRHSLIHRWRTGTKKTKI